MIRSAIICLLLAVALYPNLVSAQTSEWNRTELTDAALVGIIIGVIFFVIIVIALIFMCMCFLGNCFQRNDYYYNEPYQPPYFPDPPLPPLAPEPPRAVIITKPRPEKQSRPVFIVEPERKSSPPPRRALLLRDRADYEDHRRGSYY